MASPTAGGFDPREIEAALLEHPGVKATLVVGMPHPGVPEAPFAYVVADRSSDLTIHNLLEHLRKRLPPHLVPKRIALVEALPEVP